MPTVKENVAVRETVDVFFGTPDAVVFGDELRDTTIESVIRAVGVVDEDFEPNVDAVPPNCSSRAERLPPFHVDGEGDGEVDVTPERLATKMVTVDRAVTDTLDEVEPNA